MANDMIKVWTSADLGEVKGYRVPRGGDESGHRPGTFAPAGPSAQYKRNREFADYLLADLGRRVDAYVASGGRAAASTKRLRNSYIDKRNSDVTQQFVGIGVVSWLKQSPAEAYWRVIEEGTHGFIGTPLFIRKGAPFPVAHGAKPGLRTLSAGRLEELLEAGENLEPGAKSSGRIAFVRHEIRPGNFYEQVWQANRGKIESFSVQMARAYLFEAVQSGQRIVRDAGPRTGPFPWS